MSTLEAFGGPAFGLGILEDSRALRPAPSAPAAGNGFGPADLDALASTDYHGFSEDAAGLWGRSWASGDVTRLGDASGGHGAGGSAAADPADSTRDSFGIRMDPSPPQPHAMATVPTLSSLATPKWDTAGASGASVQSRTGAQDAAAELHAGAPQFVPAAAAANEDFGALGQLLGDRLSLHTGSFQQDARADLGNLPTSSSSGSLQHADALVETMAGVCSPCYGRRGEAAPQRRHLDLQCDSARDQLVTMGTLRAERGLRAGPHAGYENRPPNAILGPPRVDPKAQALGSRGGAQIRPEGPVELSYGPSSIHGTHGYNTNYDFRLGHLAASNMNPGRGAGFGSYQGPCPRPARSYGHGYGHGAVSKYHRNPSQGGSPHRGHGHRAYHPGSHANGHVQNHQQHHVKTYNHGHNPRHVNPNYSDAQGYGYHPDTGRVHRLGNGAGAWPVKRGPGHAHRSASGKGLQGHPSGGQGGGNMPSSAASTTSVRSSSIASEDGDDGGVSGRGSYLDHRCSLQEQVTRTAENILQSAAGGSLKAVELANTIRSRLGTDTLSAIRKQFGGLLTLLESQPEVFLVRRIPKSDIVSLRTQRRSSGVATPLGPGQSRTPSPGMPMHQNHRSPGGGGGQGNCDPRGAAGNQIYYVSRPAQQWRGQSYVVAEDARNPPASAGHFEAFPAPAAGVRSQPRDMRVQQPVSAFDRNGDGSRTTYVESGGAGFGHAGGNPSMQGHRTGFASFGGDASEGRRGCASPVLSEDLVEAITVETMVPTQAWSAEPARDMPFVTAVAETLTQLGATATISKLRGHLKHRLHLAKSVKTVPLKAFMRAYPQYFKVLGNTAALQLHAEGPMPVTSVPVRMRSGGPGVPLHYIHH